MSLKMYEAAKHQEMVRGWLLAHECEDATPMFPPVGVIVDDCFAVFLIQTDSGLGFIDFFIGDPKASREAIKDALPKGCIFLGDLAKALGIKRIFAMVDRQSTAQLCIDNGFQEREKIRVFMRSH